MSATIETPAKPVPVPSALAKPFWDALQRHEFMLQRCANCGHCNHPPQLICTRCHSKDVQWTEVAQTGTLYSYTIVHRPPILAYKPDVPYGVGLVDIDGTDARLLSNVLCPPSELRIGMRVQLVFETASEAITLFKFKPIGEATR